MDDEITFTAPDGATVLLAQFSTGGWEVIWNHPTDADSISDYAEDGPKDDYETVELTTARRHVKLVVWEDGAGRRWLSRHLIRAGAQRLSPEAVTMAQRDYAAAEAVDRANALITSLLGCKALLSEPNRPDSPLGDLFRKAVEALSLCGEQAGQLHYAWEAALGREQFEGRGVAPAPKDGEEG